jgi:hypothetical protein
MLRGFKNETYKIKRIGGDISWDANLKFESEHSTKIQMVVK